MVLASWPFLAYVILPTWLGSLPLFSRGGGGGGWVHISAPHWSRSWASPNKWVTIGKQAHAMANTKDLYSAYCPIYRRVYTPSTIFLIKSVTSEGPAFLCMP